MVKIHRATQVHCGMLYCTQSLKPMISIMWGQVSFDQASFFMPEFGRLLKAISSDLPFVLFEEEYIF